MSQDSQRSPESIESIRLLQLDRHQRIDYLLATVIAVFSGRELSAGLPLGFLVGGVIVRGRLGRSEDFAEALDEVLLSYIQGADFRASNEVEKEPLEKLRASLIEAFQEKPFAENVARRRRHEGRVREALEKELGEALEDPDKIVDLSDLPSGLAKDAVITETPPAAFTLDQAEIATGAGAWIPVGKIRVHLRQVDAWWIEAPARTASSLVATRPQHAKTSPA